MSSVLFLVYAVLLLLQFQRFYHFYIVQLIDIQLLLLDLSLGWFPKQIFQRIRLFI